MLTISFLLFVLGATLIIYGFKKYLNPVVPSCKCCKYSRILYRDDNPYFPNTDYVLYSCLKHGIISTPLYPSEVLYKECRCVCPNYTCDLTKIKTLSNGKIVKMGRLDELMYKKIKHFKILIITCGVCGCMLIITSFVFIIGGATK